MIVGIIPILIVLAFVAGNFWAGSSGKKGVERFFAGIALGLGIIFVIAGVAFAGCCVALSQMKF
jgi:hypothetical protein